MKRATHGVLQGGVPLGQAGWSSAAKMGVALKPWVAPQPLSSQTQDTAASKNRGLQEKDFGMQEKKYKTKKYENIKKNYITNKCTIFQEKNKDFLQIIFFALNLK